MPVTLIIPIKVSGTFNKNTLLIELLFNEKATDECASSTGLLLRPSDTEGWGSPACRKFRGSLLPGREPHGDPSSQLKQGLAVISYPLISSKARGKNERPAIGWKSRVSASRDPLQSAKRFTVGLALPHALVHFIITHTASASLPARMKLELGEAESPNHQGQGRAPPQASRPGAPSPWHTAPPEELVVLSTLVKAVSR